MARLDDLRRKFREAETVEETLAYARQIDRLVQMANVAAWIHAAGLRTGEALADASLRHS